MSAPRIDRRTFLVAALGTGSAVAFIGLRPWRFVVAVTPQTTAERLTSVLEHPASARVVGAEYLAAGGERQVPELVRRITDGLRGGKDAIASASSSELRLLLADRVQRDFEEDRTVELQGWVVSKTEGRLCALEVLGTGADRPAGALRDAA